MPLRFTFRQLEYLVAVADAGTIAAASHRINVSSPSISAAISQVETELGIQIFVRHHAQGLSLTPGGRRLVGEARDILDRAAALTDLAGDITEKVRGPITIGALSTVAPILSAALRRSFEAAFPEARVSLRSGNQVDLLQMLGRAEIDVALTYDLEIPKNIAFEQLAKLPPYVMLPAKHPMVSQGEASLKSLVEEPMVLLDLPLSREYFLSMFHNSQLRPDIAERTTDLSVARSLVANGFGFSLVNLRMPSATAPDGAPLAFLPLKDRVRPMVLGLATKQATHRSGVVQAFFDHTAQQVRRSALPGMA